MPKSDRSAFSKSQKSNKVSIKIPSHIQYIRKVSDRILDGLSSYGVNNEDIFDIRLCVEEAVRNAIVHGNRSDRKRSVGVSYWLDNGAMHIEIEDEGKGFDYKSVPNPTKDENILKNSGRGVYIIQKLMDRVQFNKNGNKIIMVKTLKARQK